MRIATYNVEWFDALFDDSGQLRRDAEWSARHKVTRADQIAALGRVFQALDADAIMVIEAPDSNRKRNTVVALESFAKTFDLRAWRALMGFVNTTQQEIALLYDPDVIAARHDPQGALGVMPAPRFDGTFHIDLDIDATEDKVNFSKPPLEVAVISLATGAEFRLIGAHLKSKAPHGAHGHDEVMRFSIANRRKQLAQAVWLRARVAEHLNRGDSLILLGDLNDGPGLDEYEHLFGRSSVEIILGAEPPRLYDPHAAQALTRRIGDQPTSARFYIRPEHRYLQALLDYAMVSPDLRPKAQRWRIWHPFEDAECWETPELRDALLCASDHFPLTLDIAL
ncbi:endonuclease/exonuclease/phosphatase family protein [Puniceibacterium sp. IMCC21224]|uniref:endonuclease/exonuclease/phosphatase family protein n=1 Tax=Puniceibacterium sp. IMCC21224 TaxID=1618204 RepID=UPI00064DAC53|nr:endonuclease/exonuclease/phosphatase family protein [Puniceibacterium sp. IMCC21224]KMK67677.1 endonuclease/exonuclease/phosphatase family protein [Puniceibacterium sp. IMCC21224]